MLERWLTEERLRLYPRALSLALALALALPVLLADGAHTVGGALGGDYAAFHAAGELLRSGSGASLYDWAAQAGAQRGLHPDEPGHFLAFAYPPFVALPYAALASLGFVAGYVVHTAAALGALALAIRVLAGLLPRAGRHPFALFVAAWAFLPLLRSVAGGQNTQFTLLILALTWWLLHRRRSLAAGAVAGLLLAKPQFGLPLLCLLALRHPGSLPGAAATAAALYALGAVVGGWRWLPWWWGQLGRFQQADQAVDAANSVGILGWLGALLGPDHPLTLGLGGVALVALVAGLVLTWRAARIDAGTRWGLTAVGLALLPPHSLSYDAGLGILGWLVWLDRASPGSPWPAVLWLAALLSPASAWIGISPLLPVLVGIAVGVWRSRPTGG